MREGKPAATDLTVDRPSSSHRRSLKWTLLISFLATSLLPLVAVSTVSYIRAKDSLRDAAYDSLAVEANAKAAFIDNWFHYRFIDLDSQATSINSARFLSELRDEFLASGKDIGSFVKSFRWAMIADEYATDLRSFRRMYDYHDVFLIDNAGNILFTVAMKDDFGTNLFQGPYAKTQFADACRKALATGRPAFSDLEYYAASNGRAAGFMASVIVDEDGEKLGVLAVQIPLETIDNVMVQKTGHRATYLVGFSAERGVTLRSSPLDAHDQAGNTVQIPNAATNARVPGYLNQRVNTEQARIWIEQLDRDDVETAAKVIVYDGPAGRPVLGIYKNVTVGDIKWGLIAEIDEHLAFSAASRLQSLVLVLVVATGVVVLVIATIVTGHIVRPIARLSNAARQVAEGDLTHKIECGTANEIGDLALSFGEMVDGLRKAAEEQASQDWFKTGQSGIGQQMRGEEELAPLARNIVTYLAKYLNAQIGAFYVPNDEQCLKMVGSYAYQSRKNLANTYEVGEGLVGQAALEQEHILLTNVPNDYIAVSSGLGETPPRNILVWPIVRDGEVKGVIELGSLEPFEDRYLELLRQVAENVAIAIDAAQSRERLHKLLLTSRSQSEQLRIQTEALQSREDELKKSNRHLAEKTEKLQASEEVLQQQSHELQTSNEELVEKTESLQQQKTLIEQAKREVEEKAEEVALASKYKSEFLANMSHELRTPLNSLLILAKSLADNEDGNLTPDQVEAASVIHDGGHELLKLINDILDLAKVESGKLEVHFDHVNLHDLAENLHGQFIGLAEQRGLTLENDLADDLPKTLATDAQKLEQVLRNLLSNAVKFTEEGSVTLRIGRPDANTQFANRDLTPETSIAFSVIDTGIGIPPEKQKAIFESFQQADGSTSRKFGGTGLGLTISREFAKLLGGEITLHSEPGKGSTFMFCLPLEPNGVAVSEHESVTVYSPTIEQEVGSSTPPLTLDGIHNKSSASAPTPVPKFVDDDRATLRPGDKTILVVEDDKRFACVLMDLCRKKDFKCLAVNSGGVALQLAAEFKLSGILLDLGLPDMDGMVVLDELKHNMSTRHIPVHIVSGREKNMEALTKGAIGFLTKPVTSDEVMHALDKVEELLNKSKRRLLVIEDEATMRRFIAKAVPFEGVEHSEAASAMEGYQKLQDGTFDCLILDFDLGDMNGLELLRKLEEDSIPVPPVVVYSGSELSTSERRELEAYGCTVVTKNAASPELLADKVSLFLHCVESSLSEKQRRTIAMLHDPAERIRGKKILLVDDDMRNLFALSKTLEKAGLNVALAENGQHALDVLRDDDGIDLVLMDIMMPVMDGYEATRRIRNNKRTATMPVIALTANAMPEDRAKCLDAGANDYLTKPVDPDRLLSLIRVWIFNQTVVCK